MPRRGTTPLVNDVELQTRSITFGSADDDEKPKKPWYFRLPLLVTVILILAPQPSVLRVLVDHHWRVMKSPLFFAVHLAAIYTLTFTTLTSLLICVTRDPGPVNTHATRRTDYGGDDEDIGLAEALMADDTDYTAPGKWCRKCWAPKPERAHHCSVCGRCVMKMDHHCPWLGSSCIGHRTYPAFVHFLTCATLLAIYIATVSVRALIYSFQNPYGVDEVTPVHELVLSMYGIIISIVIGPFAAYNYYLITTNQTTLEHISPFMLLRHLPPLPRTGHSLSDPPLEPELSYEQRRIVKDAHGKILMYDLGWRRNWAQVFGWNTRWGWVPRLLCGGASPGDGTHQPRNPRADELLAKLAEDLIKADRNFR
ncbi:DHHC palmitoyltransferase-domain-containing protein [Ephemerocybe angulata]|uniref:Palmitoyltransferase n=1 Tax=Ephemerocybe angulata TaxID=980116 RepID=A0A8H6I0P6_9AGAR|nr:DHHC palmitoyltransferase-domain-containing protein [Tulosesus angulatus]